jgi:hypothetical protein
MSGLVRAVGAAINPAASLYAVAQDAAIAVRALRRERMHRAFETIEDMRFAVFRHSKCFVVIVSASLALCHGNASVTNRSGKHG